MPEGTCKVQGCERPARTRQMCNTHYGQWWRAASPSDMKYRRGAPKPPCSVEGCRRPTKARGWCAAHYYHWRTKGDPLGALYENTGRIVRASGYVAIWEPDHALAQADGYVAEHRKVVHDAGIPIPEGTHVHHINGDKTDNRLENLEVVDESEHHRRHIAEQGYVTNQFGTWPLRNA